MKNAKLKKRLKRAFPDTDPDDILKAIVPMVRYIVQTELAKQNQTQPEKKKAKTTKSDPPKKPQSAAKDKASISDNEEEEPWTCAGKVWIIPNEPCPHSGNPDVKKSKSRTRWANKLHTLCKSCKKEHNAWKKENKKTDN